MILAHTGEERITVGDPLDARRKSGAHVTLIGCSSGRSEISAHHDLLDLSTALMHAGARSVLIA